MASDRIDLWLACCSDSDEPLLEAYRRLLPEEERSRAQRFHFERDRRRYVVTRALVRTVLSSYARTAPSAWQFRSNAYGRPEVVTEGEVERQLSFNISHTSDLILLGVTRRNPIGIDIEDVRRVNGPLDIADRFFSSGESAALKALPSSAQPDRFCEYWTLKESYIKARGIGLSIPLDSCEFDFPSNGRIRLSSATPSTPTAASWGFWQLRPAPGHVASVCVQREPGLRQTLSLRKVVPLGAHEPLGWSVLRQSDDVE